MRGWTRMVASGCALTIISVVWAGSPPPPAGPSLRVVGPPQHCYLPDDLVQIQLQLVNVTSATPVAGFQAFTTFDESMLEFVSASYSPAPLGLPIITPIQVTDRNRINLAAGIDAFNSQPPATSNGLLATLTFRVLVAQTNPMIHFTPHVPPTNMTTPSGDPVSTLQVATELVPSLGDLNGDGIVNGLDLGILLFNWSIPPGSPGCGGVTPCAPDLNCDSLVNGLDIGILLINWTL
jgi:hypothetical protein